MNRVTTLASRSKTVEIGLDKTFVMIGERINPTNRKKLTGALKVMEAEHDTQSSAEFQAAVEYLQGMAIRQVEAGAQVLDVNVAFAGAEEHIVMPVAVRAILDAVDVPLSIDSPNAAAVEAGLSVFNEVTGGKALINSTTAEPERMEKMVPLAKKFGAALIGLSHGPGGIPDQPEGRVEAAQTIMQHCQDYGVPAEDLLVDSLTLTVGADHRAPWVCIETTRQVMYDLGLNTTTGASNVAFGLPDRKRINITYLPMLVSAGLVSAITNPLEEELLATVYAADMLFGRDPSCLNWINYNRSKANAG